MMEKEREEYVERRDCEGTYDEGAEEDRRTGDTGVQLEENTKWMVGTERGLVEIAVLTLHSFVYPPELSIRPVATHSHPPSSAHPLEA